MYDKKKQKCEPKKKIEKNSQTKGKIRFSEILIRNKSI